jgi:redox-sensitive bicupin YhaK (pirin superfamily)
MNGKELKKGDGAAIAEESKIEITSTGDATAEFLLFDLA